LVLHVAVNVQRLVELGKIYPWPRPKRCLSCGSGRVWGHGYAQRYFEGYVYPLWVKRFRCPDCSCVYTMRPDLFYRRFRHPSATILASLVTRLREHRWLSCLPRQNQQYWYSGFRLQVIRFSNVPDTAVLDTVLSYGLVPVSHSLDCALMRM
jgi:hypothetical protein